MLRSEEDKSLEGLLTLARREMQQEAQLRKVSSRQRLESVGRAGLLRNTHSGNAAGIFIELCNKNKSYELKVLV